MDSRRAGWDHPRARTPCVRSRRCPMCERPLGRSPANALAQALVWFVLGTGASWAQDAPVQPIDRSKLLQKRVVPAQAPTESMTQVPAQAATRKPTAATPAA